MNEVVIVSLLLFCIAREIMFHISTQKLVNKVMAGSYQGYLASERTIGKSREQEVKIDEEPKEDLRYLA